ncbi:hypothetical protein FH039_03215 [Thermococcus indicus]|uniref:Uncharacterized protein n=1 Tax=Thermococcus indicus TaxID=2586643 RepID=A0A4Y5SK94_9EURY|nr:hypothetical protein [Thermococcus indicus]QDA30814.1 hypothetical protein FH039_03215 [Thermococcus indicus]
MDTKLLTVKSLLAERKREEALNIAEGIADRYWRDYALKWVAEAYAENPGRAMDIAQRIVAPTIRDETLRSLSYLFSKEGNFKAALEAARMITNQFTRKKAFRTVSNYLAKSIIQKGVSEVRLSELDLTDRDIEDLKPLPYGLAYKDGKIMPGAEILPIKGEMKMGIIPRFEKRLEGRTPPKPVFAGEDTEKTEYVSEYILKLIDEGNLEEARKLAKGLAEPMKSALLEEIGMEYLKRGNVETAEKIFEELVRADMLGAALIELHPEDENRIQYYLSKVYNPVTRLLVIYEATKRKGVREDFLRRTLLWATDEWKLGRILKFLAFEMLNEAKRTGDDGLRKTSKGLFELGKRIENGSLIKP